MNEDTIKLLAKLGEHCSQTQAAAFAVLASAVREQVREDRNSRDGTESVSNLEVFLLELEQAMVDSIRGNDGMVAKHIGHASRQMHPLL